MSQTQNLVLIKGPDDSTCVPLVSERASWEVSRWVVGWSGE